MVDGDGGVEIQRWWVEMGCRDTEMVDGDRGVEIQRWWMEIGV